MLSLTSLLILQIVAAVSGFDSANDRDRIIDETGIDNDSVDAMSTEDEELAISLLQTDVVVAPKADHGADGSRCSSRVSSIEDSGTVVSLLRTMWRWVTQADASTKDANEAAKRFHKDFIAAALLMTCVLPWSRPSSANELGNGAAHQRFARMLPSGQPLRCVCVFLLFLKHYCIGSHLLLDTLFVMVGAIFDFAEMHSVRDDDMWRKLGDFVPERFARLYPVYTLLVISCYLIFFSSPCSIESLMGDNLLLSYSCALGTWALSLVFGCYLVTVVMATPPQLSQPSNVAMICAGCVAMVVLPRTLAAPVHGPWVWAEDESSRMHSHAHGAMHQMFFSRRSLLLGLAHYFLGVVLARIRLVMRNGCLFGKQEEGTTTGMLQECQSKDKADSDQCHAVKQDAASQWKEFEDEAQRDILRSLSVGKTAEPEDNRHARSMSPRSSLD